MITRLSGLDAGGPEGSDRGRMPDWVAAGGGRRGGRIPGCGHGPTTEVLCDQQPREAPHDGRFPRRHHHLGGEPGRVGRER
jgi:hypothetical protein